MHVVAAKAVAFKEALQPEFADYAAAIVRNAAALADALAAEGFRIVSGGTDNHLMLVDLRPFGVTGKVAQEALDRAGITCNKNAIPNDPEKPFVTSGLRLGTAAVTTAGMREARDARDLVASSRRCCARSTTTTSPKRSEPRPPSLLQPLRPRTARVARRREWTGGEPTRRRGALAVGSHVRQDADDVPGYLTVAGVAAVVTFLLTFVMRWIAPRIGAIAMPGPRSVHTRPTPSLGGAAMFAGFLVAMAVASQLDQFHEIFADNTEPLGLLLAGGGDVRRRRDRRPARRVAAGEDRGAGAERQHPVAARRHHALLPRPVRQLRVRGAVARPRAARHRAHGRGDGERDQPDRRSRRPRLRDRDDRGRGDVPVRRPAVQGRAARRLEHGPAGRGDHRRDLRGVPARTTSTRRASSWATPARCSSACCWRPRRSPSGGAPPTRSAARPTSTSRRSPSRS